MNIGSRPSKRKPSGGIESLRAIPWIFAWTQTRFNLPIWLGFGAAMKHAIAKDARNMRMLTDMYNEWPFFRVTVDLVEMVLAKGDPEIAALYDKILVSEDLWPFAEQLRANYEATRSLILKVIVFHVLSEFVRIHTFKIVIIIIDELRVVQVAGHTELLQGDPYLRQRLRLRDPYINVLNVCQIYTLKRVRDPTFCVEVGPHLSKERETEKPAAELVKLNPTSEYAPGLEDTLILTMKGIAAGMQNTG